MPTLTEYFRSEARDLLETLERAVAGGRPDTAELHRTARGLRGTAQIAREERFFRAVLAFENVTRSAAAGVLAWSEDMTERVRSTVADLQALLEPHADASELEARAAAVASRWQRGSPATPPAVAPATDSREFREFAGREAAAIAETIEQGIGVLQADPMDREPLRAILRRQRALLGAARLDEIPVVAEILRAIEDLTRVVVKLDVGVKKEWLDIYRVARDGLQAAIAALVRGEDPEPSHALSRLRHMRSELLDRYGEGVAVSTVHDGQSLVEAAPFDTASGGLDPRAANEGAVEQHSAQHVAAAPLDAMARDADVLELSEAAVIEDDDVMVLSDDAIIDDEAMLELNADAVVEEDAILELSGEADLESDIVLELSDEVGDDGETVLELSDVVGDDGETVLELSDEVGEDGDTVLELSDEADLDGDAVLELSDEAAADDDVLVRRSTDAPLERALELGEVLARATAPDPRARAALDELMTILRDALE